MKTTELQDSAVLVTGGAGFIGSALVRRLVDRGNSVTVIDSFMTGSPTHLDDVRDDISVIEGDIRDLPLQEIIEDNGITHVFHLAAEPFIPGSFERPEEFFSINANGTLRVLTACMDTDVERIVYYSSSEVYGTAQTELIDEDHRLFPQSTYAVSKAAADRLAFTMYHEHDLPVVILRQFNCYGPRMTHPYVIPEMIAQLEHDGELRLGNLDARRDFTYVDDSVRGAMLLANCPAAEGEAVNLGTGEARSIREIASMVGELLGHPDPDITVEEDRFRPLDVQRLRADTTKIEQLIGYEPTTSFEDGLRQTIEWYHEEGGWIWEDRQ